VLSGKSFTGTLCPPSNADAAISTNDHNASQRARPRTTLNNDRPPASTIDQYSNWRMKSTLYCWRS
jgi:hypothetical protein